MAEREVPAALAGPSPLSRADDLPLWQQLRDDIARRIRDGEFEQVDFPGEHALAASYAVSRQTVRFALRSLRESGIVTAERGRAPRVGRTLRQPLGSLYSLFASVEATGSVQRSVVRSLEARRDAVAAGRLGMLADQSVIFLERLRLVDDEPFALDQVWLPGELAAPLLEADFTRTSLYGEMWKRLGVAPGGGQEEVAAVSLSGEEAKLLAVRPRTAGFLVLRLGCFQGKPMEWRRTLVRGDRFRMMSSFAPGAANAGVSQWAQSSAFCGSENP